MDGVDYSATPNNLSLVSGLKREEFKKYNIFQLWMGPVLSSFYLLNN
ncbi:MAG: hypothetical protein ACK40G_13970 [Cytophagaceae bacterium]